MLLTPSPGKSFYLFEKEKKKRSDDWDRPTQTYCRQIFTLANTLTIPKNLGWEIVFKASAS